MYRRVLKYFGMGVIIFFSALSIFFSLIQREVKSSSLKKVISYPALFEDRFFDWRLRKTAIKSKKDHRIVLAEIDDESLKKIGRWPLSRNKWAKFVNKLQTFGARVIAFDVFFSEPEIACNQIPPDENFADAIKKFQSIPGNKIILPYGADVNGSDHFDEVPNIMLDFMLKTKRKKGLHISNSKLAKSVFPLKTLTDVGPALGLIRAEKDYDGIFRNYPLVVNFDGLYFPSFPVIIYQAYKGRSVVLHLLDGEEKYLVTENGFFDINYKGETKVRWIGGIESFPRINIHKILNSKADDPSMHKLFKGNIVFVGSTAYGAHDLRNTPIHSELPGVLFHMNMTHMILDGLNFQPRGKSTFLSWCLLLGATLLMVFVMTFRRAILDITFAIIIALGLLLLDLYFLTPNGYEIKLFFCLFSVLSCYLWSTIIDFYNTTKEKNKIKGTFSRFVSPAVVEEMLDHPDLVKVGGERKNITVFFSDIRDFTKISEHLSPEDLSTCLNQYMGEMTRIIFECLGTLDKYIGDAIVAFWGAPIGLKNHAYHALNGAIGMIEALPKLNKSFKTQGLPTLQHGIGLNTGECSVGNMGSDTIFSYTAIGDNVNLGARLEQLCKHYGIQLHISEFTKNAIPIELQKEFTFRIIDHMKVLGRDRPVTTFEVLHNEHPFRRNPQALKDYLTGFRLYEEQKFDDSIAILNSVLELFPSDKPTQLIIENCKYYLKNPPGENWDKVTTHKTKT